jgi:hypothetical protein
VLISRQIAKSTPRGLRRVDQNQVKEDPVPTLLSPPPTR